MTSMKSTPPLDLPRLGDWLERHVAGFHGLRQAKPLTGGNSNPIWKLEADSGIYVLRTQPAGELLQSAHALDREYRVISALQNGAIPIAPVHALCNDPDVIGVQFYLMDFLEGDVFRNPALPGKSNAERTAIFNAAIDMLARIHSVDVDRVGLSDFGRQGNYFERQLHRWSKQVATALPDGDATLDALIGKLRQQLPEDDPPAVLLHGDSRLDNLMFSSESQILAVLDWELSTLGDPLADLGQFLAVLDLPPDYLLPGLRGLDRAALGIPSETSMATRYFEATRRPHVDLKFYKAFALFRQAAMSAGLRRRALLGTAVSDQALAFGNSLDTFAGLGLEILNGGQAGNHAL
ncbi:aminoglycoside phosphotransferase [Alcanivorax xiamenensis]|uniref:Aminoglycoside phosphotransferase n=1 Tax=Alcanivorax xiamenensis TaxID=1177156 RepID=A0ABQ6YBY9_9GAMM|nr:phosphotransferase family protein [Alcanivorax xiamenensis]KAF0807646.1 aminoglycoside phosphotransferase [Alcanivorax xiamenensis]